MSVPALINEVQLSQSLHVSKLTGFRAAKLRHLVPCSQPHTDTIQPGALCVTSSWLFKASLGICGPSFRLRCKPPEDGGHGLFSMAHVPDPAPSALVHPDAHSFFFFLCLGFAFCLQLGSLSRTTKKARGFLHLQSFHDQCGSARDR